MRPQDDVFCGTTAVRPSPAVEANADGRDNLKFILRLGAISRANTHDLREWPENFFLENQRLTRQIARAETGPSQQNTKNS